MGVLAVIRGVQGLCENYRVEWVASQFLLNVVLTRFVMGNIMILRDKFHMEAIMHANVYFNFLRVVTELSKKFPLLLGVITIAGCSGGDIDGGTESGGANNSITLGRLDYSTGDKINLTGFQFSVKSVDLVFVDGRSFALPLQPDGNVIVPVLDGLAGKSAKLSLATSQGTKESGAITLQSIPVLTSKSGVATIIYLDASLDNIGRSVDELLSLSNNPSNPELQELNRLRSFLQTLRSAVVQAQSGDRVLLSHPSDANLVYLDKSHLDALDQYVSALLGITGGPAKNGQAAGQSARAKPMAITSINCAGLIDSSDRAWCSNMRTQLANDYIINYAGMIGSAGTLAAGALTALAAVGVSGVAFPAALLGAASIGVIVAANAIGGAVQGASAYGTGTAQGVSIRDNVKNLTDAARDLALGQVAKLFPTGGSNLVGELNGAVTGLVAEKLLDNVNKVVDQNTKAVPTCTAQASSGGQGSFANRYDFGVPRKLLMSYQAYSVPDMFSVFDASGQISGTGGLVSGGGSLSAISTTRYVTVKVSAPNTGTAWDYSISCVN